MSGEGGSMPMMPATVPVEMTDYRVLFDPSPDEAQALADNLRDMLASGQMDQRVVRQAANALEAVAIAAQAVGPLPGWTWYDEAGIIGEEVFGAPIPPPPVASWSSDQCEAGSAEYGPALETYEEGHPSREGSAP